MNNERWVRITAADRIPVREGRAALVGGREIAIFNLGDRLRRGRQPLSAPGRPALPTASSPAAPIVCPLHAWKISLRDRCGRAAVRHRASACAAIPRASRRASCSSSCRSRSWPVTRTRRHDHAPRRVPAQRPPSDADRGAAVLRRQLHGVGAARPARAVPARGARPLGDAAGPARRHPAARRLAVPAGARRARRPDRRTPHRAHRPRRSRWCRW